MQGVDLDVLGDVVQLLLEIISTILVQNIAVRVVRLLSRVARRQHDTLSPLLTG